MPKLKQVNLLMTFPAGLECLLLVLRFLEERALGNLSNSFLLSFRYIIKASSTFALHAIISPVLAANDRLNLGARFFPVRKQFYPRREKMFHRLPANLLK